MNWRTELLQLVVFDQPAGAQDAFQVWLQLFESTPDGYQKHPDPNAMATQATGSYAGYDFQVHVAPGRTDLFIVNNDNGPDKFPEILNVDAALDLLKQKSIKLIAGKQVYRLAIVTQLFQNFPETEMVMAEFTKHTNIPLLPKSTDMSFTSNFPKNLNTDNVYLNRICRWQALVKQLLQVQLNEQLRPGGPSITQPALGLNVDLNTVPRQVPLSPEHIIEVMDNLFSELNAVKELGLEHLIL